MVQDDHAVGRRLRRLRDLAGMTQAEVAQRMTDEGVESIYPQTVTRIEAGQRSLKWAEAEAFARVIGFDLAELAADAESTITRDRLARTVMATLDRKLRDRMLLDAEIAAMRQNLFEIAEGVSPAVAEQIEESLRSALG